MGTQGKNGSGLDDAVLASFRDIGFVVDDRGLDMTQVFVRQTMYEMPGDTPTRQEVLVPIARLPAINGVMLQLTRAVMEVQAAHLEYIVAPDVLTETRNERDEANQTAENLRCQLANMEAECVGARNRIQELEADRRNGLVIDAQEVREWKEMSVFVKLWAVLSGKTIRRRLLVENVEERRSLPR